jgi:hypothetical protein
VRRQTRKQQNTAVQQQQGDPHVAIEARLELTAGPDQLPTALQSTAIVLHRKVEGIQHAGAASLIRPNLIPKEWFQLCEPRGSGGACATNDLHCFTRLGGPAAAMPAQKQHTQTFQAIQLALTLL